MELPFLKKKQGLMGPPITKRVSDHKEITDQVADEFMEAIEKKDIKAFHSALEALVLMIHDEDEAQDE